MTQRRCSACRVAPADNAHRIAASPYSQSQRTELDHEAKSEIAGVAQRAPIDVRLVLNGE
jgi:hypothetical protein